MQNMTNNPGQNPDQELIETICKDNWEELYRYIYYKVQNREEAEDITQETFVKTLTHNLNFNPAIYNLKSYLKTIALNIIRDRWRRQKTRSRPINIEEVNSQYI